MADIVKVTPLLHQQILTTYDIMSRLATEMSQVLIVQNAPFPPSAPRFIKAIEIYVQNLSSLQQSDILDPAQPAVQRVVYIEELTGAVNDIAFELLEKGMQYDQVYSHRIRNALTRVAHASALADKILGID